jgi:antitoxin component YwqK of YwqJK toxin-antitoxin module
LGLGFKENVLHIMRMEIYFTDVFYDENGRFKGKYVVHHPNGNVFQQYYYDESNRLSGEYKAYYDNTKPKTYGQYAHGRKVGDWVWYDETGEIKEKKNVLRTPIHQNRDS